MEHFRAALADLEATQARITVAIEVMRAMADGAILPVPVLQVTTCPPAPAGETKRAKRATNGAARETKPAKAETPADAEETSAQIVVRTLRESGGPLTGAELGDALEEAGRFKRSVYAVLKTLVEADLIGRVNHNGIDKWALKKGV